jgi:hypothetical protein
MIVPDPDAPLSRREFRRDKIDQLTDVLGRVDLLRREPDVQRRLDRDDQPDMRKTVPFLDIVGGRLIGENDPIVIENFTEYFRQPRPYVISGHRRFPGYAPIGTHSNLLSASDRDKVPDLNTMPHLAITADSK